MLYFHAGENVIECYTTGRACSVYEMIPSYSLVLHFMEEAWYFIDAVIKIYAAIL